MRLSDVKGERVIDVIADIIDPIANISRIMKRSIPATAKISKDAKECVQECVSEFIAFITSECLALLMT